MNAINATLTLFVFEIFCLCSLVMVFTWFFAKAKNNYSVVDIVWSFLFFCVAWFASIFSAGFLQRKYLLLLSAGVWSLRLSSFLTKRIYAHHPNEDLRYQEMRAAYAPQVARGFFWFFQFQAWSVVLLSIPFVLIARNPNPAIRGIEWVGFTVALFAVAGEALADAQKKKFKQEKGNQGKNCEVGLWRYSRHPNYFFESLIWWGFYLFALGSVGGVYTLYCPILMLILLLKVTGVPLSERQGIKLYGDAYLRYQKRTSIFIPWKPRA